MPGNTEAPIVTQIYPALLGNDVKPEVAVGATTQVAPSHLTATQASALRGTATGIKVLLTPMLVSTLSGAVQAWSTTPDPSGFNYLIGTLIVTASPLLVQGFNSAIDGIESTIERPELATQALTTALQRLRDPVGTLNSAFTSLMKNLSPYQLARQSREMLTNVVRLSTVQFVQALASSIGSAPLATSIQLLAPAIGATASTVFDYSMHRLAPLFEVDPDTVPDVGKPYLLLRCIPTKVTARSESTNGTFRVTLAPTGEALPPVGARGTVVVAFADEGRIQSFADLGGLTLQIGDIELSNLTGSWSPAGLAITRADAVKKSGEKVVLGKLEISPLGWLSGELTIGGVARRFGSEFEGGIGGAAAPAKAESSAKSEAEGATPAPRASGGGSGLVGHIQKQMSGTLGTVASEALHVVNYLTQGKNGAATKPASPPAPENTAHSLGMKMFGAEPAALLAKLSGVQLIPESMKNRVGLDVTELRVGEEPSLTLGLNAWIRPFQNQPQLPGVEGLKLIWLVNKEPYVLLQANELVVDSKRGVFCGIEADPAGGLRIAAARVVLPGVDIPGLFSDELVAIAEGIRIGEHFAARSATAMVKDLRISNALTVGQFAVGMNNRGETHEFHASITDGKLVLSQLTASVPTANLSWLGGGAELTASGKAKLDAPITINDMLVIDSAALDFDIQKNAKSGTGTAGITFHLDRYTAALEATVEIDGEGIKMVKLAAATLHDADKQAVAIKGFVYERGKTLKVERAEIAVPEAGTVRGVATERGKPSALVLEHLDFSALVRAPAKEGEAPASGEAAPAWSIKGENLSKLVVGPAGHDILTVDFVTAPKTPRDAKAPPGGLHALVTMNLGPLSANADVDVYPAKEGLDRVTVALGALAFGTAMKIQSASFDGARLAVKKAEVDLKALLGKDVWPDALDGLAARLELDLDLDTNTGVLETLKIGGTASGQLFGKYLTLGEATASLTVSGAKLSKTGPLVSGGSLSGNLGIKNLELDLFGAKVTVTDGKLDVSRPVQGTFSGAGTIGDATVAVTGLQLLDKKVMLGTVKTSFQTPHGADGIVKFLPPKSTCETPTDKPVTILLSGVGFDAATGQILFASDEQVTAEGGAQPTGPGPKLELENLGGIDIAGGAITLRLEDKLTAEKVRGKNEAKIAANAAVKIGPLAGQLRGTAYLALGAGDPGAADKGPKDDTSRVRLEGDASLGVLEVKEATVQRGQLTAKSASIKVGDLFSHIPGAVDAGFAKTMVTVTNVNIDLANKTFSGGGQLTLPELKLFDGNLVVTNPSLGLELEPAKLAASGPLVGINWKATLGAGSITATPVGSLAIKAGASALVLAPHLISGSLEDLAFAWKLGATAKRVRIDGTGFFVEKAAITVDKSIFSSLGIGDVFGFMPSWLVDGDSSPLVVRLGELDVGYANGKVQWPDLTALRFSVRKAGLKLGPAHGAFDLDAGTVTLGAQDKGNLKLTVPMPIAHGVGIEIGGGLDYDFSFATTAKAAKEEDLVRVIADLEAKAKLAGVLYVGLFGGAPAVFSAAAGLYAGIALDAGLQAHAIGEMRLPTGATKKGGGQLDLTFSFKDKAGIYPTLSGVAGAYASLHFLGTSRTIKKELAKINLAQLHAHGAVSVQPGLPLQLLPSRDQFPAYKFHLHEDLRKALFDDDFTEEFNRSQQRLDKSFAKVWAAEEMLADETADKTAKKPWESQKPELAKEAKSAQEQLESAELALAAIDKHEAASVDVLENLRAKLAKYRWHHAQLLKAEQQAKTPSTARMIFDAIRHPSFGVRAIKLVEGVPCIEGRVASTEPSAEKRVDDPTFPKMLGLREAKQFLSAADYEKKIDLKEQEIAVVEARRATPALKKAEDRLATAEAANLKATTKVELSTKTVAKVEQRLGDERDKLLESLYVASKLQTANDDTKLKSAATIEQLKEDMVAAKKQLAALEKDIDAPARTAKLAFWQEHEKFLTDEIAFVTKRDADQHHLEEDYTDRLDTHKQTTLDDAAKARAKKRTEIEQRIRAKVEKRRAEIEDSLRTLQGRLAEIGKRPSDEEHGASVRSIEHALELQKKQLAAYIDNIARLSALIST